MTDPLPDVEGAHRLDTGSAGTSEPVRLAHGLTTVLYALAAAGWVVIPNATIDLIGTIAAFLLATVGAELARARVSPSGRVTVDSVRALIRAQIYAELTRLAGGTPDASTLPTLLSGDVRKGA